MRFAVDDSRYRLVFRYGEEPTGRTEWKTVSSTIDVATGRRKWRGQEKRPILQRTVAAVLYREKENVGLPTTIAEIARGVVKVDPDLRNEKGKKVGFVKEILRLEALDKLDKELDICRGVGLMIGAPRYCDRRLCKIGRAARAAYEGRKSRQWFVRRLELLPWFPALGSAPAPKTPLGEVKLPEAITKNNIGPAAVASLEPAPPSSNRISKLGSLIGDGAFGVRVNPFYCDTLFARTPDFHALLDPTPDPDTLLARTQITELRKKLDAFRGELDKLEGKQRMKMADGSTAVFENGALISYE